MVDEAGGAAAWHEKDLDAVKANLASLNDIVAELVTGLAREHVPGHPEAEWAQVARRTLRGHSWELGSAFQGELPDAEWLEEHS